MWDYNQGPMELLGIGHPLPSCATACYQLWDSRFLQLEGSNSFLALFRRIFLIRFAALQTPWGIRVAHVPFYDWLLLEGHDQHHMGPPFQKHLWTSLESDRFSKFRSFLLLLFCPCGLTLLLRFWRPDSGDDQDLLRKKPTSRSFYWKHTALSLRPSALIKKQEACRRQTQVVQLPMLHFWTDLWQKYFGHFSFVDDAGFAASSVPAAKLFGSTAFDISSRAYGGQLRLMWPKDTKSIRKWPTMTKERQLHSKTNIGKIADLPAICQFCKTSTLSSDLLVVSFLELDGLVKWNSLRNQHMKIICRVHKVFTTRLRIIGGFWKHGTHLLSVEKIMQYVLQGIRNSKCENVTWSHQEFVPTS